MKKLFSNRFNTEHSGYTYLLISAVILILTFTISCSKKEKTTEAAVYTCPMHPQVVQDHPGKCPLCGMDLEKKVEAIGAGEKEEQELAALAQDANSTVIGNFKTVYPRSRSAKDTVKLAGYFGLDDRTKNIISTRVAGRIERLYVKYENQTVSKGQKLFEIYSPELLAAQRDLLFVIKNNDTQLVQNLRIRLLNLGMINAEINQIIKTGKPMQTITVFSSYSGVTHPLTNATTGLQTASTGGMGMSSSASSSPATTQANLLREGAYVNKGQALFELMGHSMAWALFSAYDKDLPFIRQGDEVQISIPSKPDHTFSGKVDFIQPYYNSDQQTATIRVYLNSHHELKIGTLIEGKIIGRQKTDGNFVPKTAVYNLGRIKIVWVANKSDNTFKSRVVTTGISNGDWIQIKSGLKEDEKVAVNASYLVDSDSFIEVEGGAK